MSRAAEELGIGRVQFQRYLRGESFPKPGLLDRICDYFDVDARILTQPVTGRLLAEMRIARLAQSKGVDVSKWLAGLIHAAPTQDYHHGPHSLTDGLYRAWRRSFAKPDKAVRVLVQVSSRDGVLCLRGFDSPKQYPPKCPPAWREFRGLALRLKSNDYALMFFHNMPMRIISITYIGQDYTANRPDYWRGFTAITRGELVDVPRASRLVFVKADPGAAAKVRLAHEPLFWEFGELPPEIGEELTRTGL
ncbi:MAG: helix-turn-helix transcriptional regulator [Rhodobacteraceae bacterium]|nr:helix-turn-helix transcriptional regulator [Paracoccaceae bacterium]